MEKVAGNKLIEMISWLIGSELLLAKSAKLKNQCFAKNCNSKKISCTYKYKYSYIAIVSVQCVWQAAS